MEINHADNGTWKEGNMPWNKGMKLSIEHKKAISNACKGSRCPIERRGNKVGTKMPDKVKARISAALRGRKVTEEMKQRISATLKGRPRSELCKAKIRNAFSSESFRNELRSRRARQILPFYDTGIEKKVQTYLLANGIIYEKHCKYILPSINSWHRVDMYIPSRNLAIECDGGYWHSLFKVSERDKLINEELFKQGVSLLRLREDEIINGEYESRMRGELNIGC